MVTVVVGLRQVFPEWRGVVGKLMLREGIAEACSVLGRLGVRGLKHFREAEEL